jgi:hypothetical protein
MPRTHASLATYYCWADLLHGPDGRPGTLLWHDASTEADVVAETMRALPEAVVVALRSRTGEMVWAYLPGGLAA